MSLWFFSFFGRITEDLQYAGHTRDSPVFLTLNGLIITGLSFTGHTRVQCLLSSFFKRGFFVFSGSHNPEALGSFSSCSSGSSPTLGESPRFRSLLVTSCQFLQFSTTRRILLCRLRGYKTQEPIPFIYCGNYRYLCSSTQFLSPSFKSSVSTVKVRKKQFSQQIFTYSLRYMLLRLKVLQVQEDVPLLSRTIIGKKL